MMKLKTFLICSEPACWFNESEITTETIAKFPTCEYACAIIVLNQNTKVPVDKLQSTFGNLQVLKGGIRVENTTLTDLSFFSNLLDLRVEKSGSFPLKKFKFFYFSWNCYSKQP